MTTDLRQTLASKSCLAIDLDGVVYFGNTVAIGAAEAIRCFRKAGKRVIFLTNNSGKAPGEIRRKLSGFGIPCDENELLTSSQSAATLIREKTLDRGQGVFVIGTPELKEEIEKESLALSPANQAGAVVVGFHPDLRFADLEVLLPPLSRGVPWVACNRDSTYPVENGRRLPALGAIVGAIEAATQKSANYNAGKPNPFMLELALRRAGESLKDCLLIGDSLDSDISMARATGVPSVWITGLLEAKAPYGDESRADFMAADLEGLSSLLE